MVQGKCERIALCLSIIGLIGGVAVSGLPMWKVMAFIGENIIVMETHWEGLWITCFRQANIHMQCKVYDSLLFLPPDLQVARGLTCCALVLSGVRLLNAMAAGVMQILASVCIIIPVSWTAHTIIRDFYNPLLIDTQRTELGEALYIGWVTSAFLLASGIIFLCRCVGPKSGSFYARPPPLIQSNSLSIQQPSPSAFSYAITPSSGQHSPYSMQPVTTWSFFSVQSERSEPELLWPKYNAKPVRTCKHALPASAFNTLQRKQRHDWAGFLVKTWQPCSRVQSYSSDSSSGLHI
uniref:Claudin 17 n=1 Tax=Sinocyclocheilus rhinocerous TaxID=307959 RepID=A0A673I7H1_9TELE